jgi:ABC-2 type transport system permease protein
MFTIAGREIRSLFLSPIAYVITGIFVIIFAYFFLSVIALYTILSVQALRIPFIAERINIQDLVIKPLFANMSVLLLFLVPMITMRTFAEEKKLGTFELIYTSPLRTWEIVLGKFLGMSSFIVFILAVSALFMFPLFKFGEPDKGVILTAYIGLLLMTTAFISAGIFASSITENQVISVIVSFGILLLFWVLGWVRGTLEGSLKEIIAYFFFECDSSIHNFECSSIKNTFYCRENKYSGPCNKTSFCKYERLAFIFGPYDNDENIRRREEIRNF